MRVVEVVFLSCPASVPIACRTMVSYARWSSMMT